MYTLFIANKNYSSWSLRPWVLMSELGIPFEEKLVPFGLSEDPRGFRAFSPSGKVPCLSDGGIVVWDSLAIAEYLAEMHPAVWPGERVVRAWARSASAEMHSGFATVRNACGMTVGLRIRLREIVPELAAEWARIDALWRDGLHRFGGPFLAGERFSAVDAFFAPVVFRVLTYSPDLSATSASYCNRLRELPSMQRWYADALAEPWRDEAHEEESRRTGHILADHRAPPAHCEPD